jgi:hypothetical protein
VVNAPTDPPPAWLAIAYDAGADYMASAMVDLIHEFIGRGEGSAVTLDAVLAVAFGRMEIGLPQDEWFRRQGGV